MKKYLFVVSALLVTGAALADVEIIEPKFERCLVGNKDTHLCEWPDGNYFGKSSVIKLIEEDLRKDEGADGRFERIPDAEAAIWSFLTGGGHPSSVRARERFAWAPLEFGIVPGAGPAIESKNERNFIPVNIATELQKLILSDCTGFETTSNQYHDSCEAKTNLFVPISSSMQKGDVFRLAIYAKSAEFSTPFFTSNPADNVVKYDRIGVDCKDSEAELGGKALTHMVAFRFVPGKDASESVKALKRFVVGFNDHVGPDLGEAGFTNYIVELDLVEPAGK